MAKRTNDELRGVVMALQQAKMSKDVQVWLKHLQEFKDAIASGAFMCKTSEDAFKNIGVIRGIDICLSLDEMYSSGLTSSIIKPS